MATITPERLTQLRQAMAADFPNPVAEKAVFNAALQAIEDTFEGPTIKAAISFAINAATAPTVLPNPVKAKLVKHWLADKFKVS